MEHETLATELLRELKASARRWFIIAIIELGIILAIVVGFLIYTGLPSEEVVIDGNDGSTSYIGRDLNGGLYNGADSSTQESETAESDDY